jgi:tetratricopeptide (TPR) repeat protein
MSQKIVLILIVLLIAVGGMGRAESVNDPFLAANRLYEKGDYTGALKIYKELETATHNWKLYYNIGNCHFKLNRPVQAKIYYLRAQRLKPFEASITGNLEIVNKMFKDQVPVEKPDFIGAVIKKIESLLPLNVLSVLLLIAVLCLNVSIFALIHKTGPRKWMIYGASLFLILTIVLTFYHMHRVDREDVRSMAVIVNANTELHSGPGENNTILFKVNPGLTVKILEQSNDWYQVSATSEIAGWVRREALEII